MDKIHLKPESAFVPTSPESKELKQDKELEFVIDQATGKIEKIGDPRDVRDWLNAKVKDRRDVQVQNEVGGIIIPSATDAHHHLLYGVLNTVNSGYLFGSNSEREIEEAIKASIKGEDPNAPKVFIGHNNATAPNIFKEQLYGISDKKPLAVFDLSFHGARFNTKMIDLVKKFVAQEKKQGRVFAGSLDAKRGIATESIGLAAMQIAEAQAGIESVIEGMKKQLDSMITQGITDMHDMLPISWNSFIASLMARKDWEKERGTKFPVRQMFLAPHMVEQLRAQQKELEAAGIFDPQKDWGMIGMKILADGSIGSHTAMMSHPFADKETKGIEFDSLDQLNKAIQTARDSGIEKIAMHAIGDAGIKRALEIARKWKKIAEEAKLDSSKFRIEHFELPIGSINETKELGIWVNMEPNFLTDFCYRDRLADRITQICPHADVINNGIPMHFGSDGMPTSALFGIWAATHHPQEKQRISFQQALAAYSLMAADYEHDTSRGRLVEGASADIVVLQRETLNELLTNQANESQLADEGFVGDKVSQLESGIARIYRQGQLVGK